MPPKTFATHTITPSSTTTTTHSTSGSSGTNGSDIFGIGGSSSNNNMNLVKVAVPSVAGGVVLFIVMFVALWLGCVKEKAEKARRREAKGKGREVVVPGQVNTDVSYGDGHGGFAELGEGSRTHSQGQQELGYGRGRYEAYELAAGLDTRTGSGGEGSSRGGRGRGDGVGLGIYGGQGPGLLAGYEGDRHWHGGHF
jgi:hypothetical protein